MLFNILLTYLW